MIFFLFIQAVLNIALVMSDPDMDNEDKINAMDDESYAQYLRYHFYICEKPEMLGMSNHLLFIGKN